MAMSTLAEDNAMDALSVIHENTAASPLEYDKLRLQRLVARIEVK